MNTTVVWRSETALVRSMPQVLDPGLLGSVPMVLV
jgi:hypothetical protein